jgi:glucosylglycerate phosphorylase
MREKLRFLYGEQGDQVLERVENLLKEYQRVPGDGTAKPWVTEDDVMLITYGDSVVRDGTAPLASLHEFLNDYAKDTVSAVHILPFYPYTSDDGFSVVNYVEVNPALGDWDDVIRISRDFDLMFDGVINHISQSSEWFQGYLQGDEKYRHFFIEADPKLDYSMVTRPRNLPLLTRFATSRGDKHIWTTFSADQIDLNFRNPDVLIEILRVLFLYTHRGARYIRLDAIGFAWKKLGTTCMHLEEVHALVKLIREAVEKVSPGTIIITETNVPHKDNISYFGNGFDEAHMVYQFPLPPLTLFSFHTKNARKLLQWADGLEPTSKHTAFFNFLASHDGIGMRPVEDILTHDEKQMMIRKTIEHGGRVSYRDNGDGTSSAYELNINYLDALTSPEETDVIRVSRSLAAHVILLSMAGVPGIYIHSFLGSRNDVRGAELSGINRRINREKLDQSALYKELKSDTLRRAFYERFSELIRLRRRMKAFSPLAEQRVVLLDDRVFSLERKHPDTGDRVIVLVNVSDDTVHLKTGYKGRDAIGGHVVDGEISLPPYGFMWIKV